MKEITNRAGKFIIIAVIMLLIALAAVFSNAEPAYAAVGDVAVYGDTEIGKSETSSSSLIWKVYELADGYRLVIYAEPGGEDELYTMYDFYWNRRPFPISLSPDYQEGEDGSYITEIVIKARVKNIGNGVFDEQHKVKTVTYEHPEDLKTIGNRSFASCVSLKDANIPATVEKIDTSAFTYCRGLTALKIPNGIREIGENAFENCKKLETVTIPANGNIKEIPDSLFSGCKNLKNVSIPDYITKIGDSAFKDCKSLTKITLPSRLETIGANAFDGSGLKSVTLPKKLNFIDTDAFARTKLTEVTIPGNVKTIRQAFTGCKSLAKVKIQEGVVHMDSTFMQCTALKTITYPKSVEEFGSMCGCSSLEEVKFADNPKIKTLSYGAFSECTSLKKLIIPSSITNFEDRAFELCDGLTEVTIPSNMKVIPDGMFYGCKNLTTVNISSGVTGIGEWAFAECPKLTKVTIPDSVKNIYDDGYGNSAFAFSGGTPKKLTIVCSSKSSAIDFAKDNGIKTVKPKKGVTKVKLSAAKYTYNGKVKKPKVTVTDSIGNKISSSNYTIRYSTGRKKVGKYTITVKFKGKYSGTKKLTFKINPPKTAITSLSDGTRSFTVKWKKKSVQVSGYEVQYSTTSKFKSGKNTKTVTVKNAKSTSKKIKNLKAGKKYFVRVRTYKTVKGVKYYSNWSKAKNVTTK